MAVFLVRIEPLPPGQQKLCADAHSPWDLGQSVCPGLGSCFLCPWPWSQSCRGTVPGQVGCEVLVRERGPRSCLLSWLLVASMGGPSWRKCVVFSACSSSIAGFACALSSNKKVNQKSSFTRTHPSQNLFALPHPRFAISDGRRGASMCTPVNHSPAAIFPPEVSKWAASPHAQEPRPESAMHYWFTSSSAFSSLLLLICKTVSAHICHPGLGQCPD
jgi:hypothetical protein